MKYNLYGFNQLRAVDLELSNNDLLFLRWFVDFIKSKKMKMIYSKEEGREYYWITYKKVIEDLPIIVECKKTNDKEESVYKTSLEKRLLERRKTKIKNLLNGNLSKVISKHVEKNSTGTYLYLSLNEKVYKTLLKKYEDKEEKTKGDENYSLEEIGGENTKDREGINLCTPRAENHLTKITLLDNDSINNKNIYIQIIEYLNKRCGSNYKSTTKKTRALIDARIKEGFTEEDFKKVIDKKCEEWISTEFVNYLRPETLFGTKFEGYLNQRKIKESNYGGFRENTNKGKSQRYDFSKINEM